MWMGRENPLITATKMTKYFGVNLRRNVWYLDKKNFNTYLKDPKVDLNKWNDIPLPVLDYSTLQRC